MRSASGLSSPKLNQMYNVMSGFVERGEMPGLVTLVSRHGEVHVEAIGMQQFGGSVPMSRDSIFRIASMTKPITAAAAMILVEECKLRLDDPVDEFLPELGKRQVLRKLESPVDDTVPAIRSITLRDLFTFRMGLGAIWAMPGQYPIQKAIDDLSLSAGPNPPQLTPDEWMKRLGTLPLIHQPGEAWMYHTSSDVLGVLISRASGMTLENFLSERIFEPLGMRDTGFHVPMEKLHRLPHSYVNNYETKELVIHDDPAASLWGRAPAFASGGGGLLSTADDYHAFCQMMLNKGLHGEERILSRLSVELMTTDHLTAEQKSGARDFLGENSSWGFGMAVNTRRDELYSVPGRFGWDGGIGTTGYTDPNEEFIGILLTQRLMDSPHPPKVFLDFWNSAYQCIDD